MNRIANCGNLSYPSDCDSSGFSDSGLSFGHINELKGCHPFTGNWSDYLNESVMDNGIVHTEAVLKGLSGKSRCIKIPCGVEASCAFRDFSNSPELAYYPSIFRAQRKLVSYCHSTSNWDGILCSSLLTIDIECQSIHHQYWQPGWLDMMKDCIPHIGNDVEMWSNGSLQLYLDQAEDQLLIHGDYLGKHEASLMFNWTCSGWSLATVVPGPYPSSNGAYADFCIGPNSLGRHSS